MNNVCLVGRLTKDPELRSTGTGKEVASFSIAVQKKFKPKDGGKDADFFNCTVWEQGARYLDQYAAKGNRVSVTGRIENRQYEANDGTMRTVTEIIADTVSILESKDSGGGGNDGGGSRQPAERAAAPAANGRARTPAPRQEDYDPFADE